MKAVFEQPFAEVTVTVQVAGVVTSSIDDVPTTVDPLDHEYVTPPVAVSSMEVVLQFNSVTEGVLIAAVGTDKL